MWAYHYPVLPADSGHAKIPYSYPYRCPVGAPPADCAQACVDFTRRMLLGKESPFTEHRAEISNVAAVLLEPMQASAGYIIPGEGYLSGIRELCDEFGFLLIDDEIQAGMGRTGRFWACEHEQVVPDMILVSKGLASGLPVSAVIADDQVAASWGPGAHVGTFTATALACAAANATLDVYESEQLVKRAADLGGYFAEQLAALQERHPILGWIDARGLFVGLEFARDQGAGRRRGRLDARFLRPRGAAVREGRLLLQPVPAHPRAGDGEGTDRPGGRHPRPGDVDGRGARGHPRRQLAMAAGPSGRHCHPAAYSTGISP
jgi:4-aminobutyrate aminotransferase-like enzyme